MTKEEKIKDLLAQALVGLEEANLSKHELLRWKIREELQPKATLERLLPESDIIKAFQGTQFGFKDPRGPREIINTSLQQISDGFATGHTATVVMMELGLIEPKKFGEYWVTRKGAEYLVLLQDVK